MAGGKLFLDDLSTTSLAATTGVTVGAAATGFVEQVATFSLTADQTKALFSATQAVVTAPVAGYYLEFVSATLWYDYGDAAFAGIATNENLQFRIGTVPVSANVETVGFLDQVADEVRHVNGIASADYEPTAATAINLYLTTGDITNAGTTSRLKGKVIYRVRPTSW